MLDNGKLTINGKEVDLGKEELIVTGKTTEDTFCYEADDGTGVERYIHSYMDNETGEGGCGTITEHDCEEAIRYFEHTAKENDFSIVAKANGVTREILVNKDERIIR